MQWTFFFKSIRMFSFSCWAKRPNVANFNSDLHLHMFNICDVTTNKNRICFYDERVSGKDGNTVCSLRWAYHCGLTRDILSSGQHHNKPPQMIIKVMDNCAAQNKSNTTAMFDSLLSLVLYDRVANFYLLPGHSHMRADQVVGLCKKALKRKDMFLPEQIAQVMSSVQNMDAKVYKEESFQLWESFLRNHFTPLPQGFTQYYHFEFANGAVQYKCTVCTEDDVAIQHDLVGNLQATKRAILKELFGVPSTATTLDIVNARLTLPRLAPPKLGDSKTKSISAKLSCIPKEYRGYYPGFKSFYMGDKYVDDQRAKPKSGPGRPKNSKPHTSTPSILKYLQYQTEGI